MLRRTLYKLGNPLHMSGYPIDGGPQGQNGYMGKQGTMPMRFSNRIGDAVDWSIVTPEWYWERGGYEPMGNMPPQWEKDGFGQWLTQLGEDELEMLVYDVMHDVILEENLRDGVELRAPHPDTYEPLYGKIPSFVFQTQGWARPDLRDRIQDRLFKAFRVQPPFHHRIHITTPIEMVSYIKARVAHARSRPTYSIPRDVKEFLDEIPEKDQPELGMTIALPEKERTSMREALKVMYSNDILWNFEYKAKTKGEDSIGKKSMYWLELERSDRLEQKKIDRRAEERKQLIAERARRRQATQ